MIYVMKILVLNDSITEVHKKHQELGGYNRIAYSQHICAAGVVLRLFKYCQPVIIHQV